jgi:membrane-bound metal-dependent hydrolase YbcI (DUF457 family)
VDIATHCLTSLALARGFFPRRPWPIVLGMILAGTLADLDLISIFFGPAAYLETHRAYTHSFLGTMVLVGIATGIVLWLGGKKIELAAGLLAAMSVAAVAHLLMDLCQSEGEALLWPFCKTRFAADYLPSIDPWILTLLVAGILLPEVFRLVSSEIGVKDKNPRGRNGALVALALVLAYIGMRSLEHAMSLALLEPHTYRSEAARRMGSFPNSLSIFAWHGVVETQSMLCQLEISTWPGNRFDPETANCWHKPEPSTELTAAEATTAAQEFLQVVRLPRATVAKTDEGTEVVIRSMCNSLEEEAAHGVAARILLDTKAQVASQALIWARDVRLR